MALLDYLQNRYLSEPQLLARGNCTQEQLRHWQEQGMAPKASYSLSMVLTCQSVLAEHQEQHYVLYYARATPAWLRQLDRLSAGYQAFNLFHKKYKRRLEVLKKMQLCPSGRAFNADLDEHIKKEWQHFLNGTYGLCTQTGHVAEIVDKEAAIAVIDELNFIQQTDHESTQLLTSAKVLLHKACAPFPEHEYPGSSRARYLSDFLQ